MNELWATLWRVLRDPRVSTVLVLAVSVLCGLVLIVAGYWGTADLALVVYQLPYVLSGGFAGIAIVGVALALLSIHFDRAEGAEERRDLAEVRRDTMRLARRLSQSRQD